MSFLSRRLPADFEPNAIHATVEAKRRSGAALLDLTETNPTKVGLPSPPAEAWRGWLEGAREPYAPVSLGAHAAREAIAAYYAERGLHADPAHIALTASTSEAYAHLFRMLGDPGDVFLTPEPSYPLFAPLAALEGVETIPYPLRYVESRWRVDLGALLLAAQEPKARGLIVVHPNNPTGSLLDQDEARAIENLCAQRRLALIADEVFADFAFPSGPRRASFAMAPSCLTFSLAGLSKTCGLPQAKLAWIACGGPEDEVAEALAALEWVTDAFLSVSSPIQRALAGVLAARGPFVEATRARLQANLAALDAAGVERLSWEGGWSAVVRAPGSRTDEEWTLALLERGVLVHPGHYFDFADEGRLVISLLPEPAIFAEAATRLKAALATP